MTDPSKIKGQKRNKNNYEIKVKPRNKLKD